MFPQYTHGGIGSTDYEEIRECSVVVFEYYFAINHTKIPIPTEYDLHSIIWTSRASPEGRHGSTRVPGHAILA
jgi:hypothetical protein